MVGSVRTGQAIRFGDRTHEAVPGDDALDRREGVASCVAHRDQRMPDAGEEPDLVVDGPRVGLQLGGGASLGPPEQPSHEPVEQADGFVGKAGHGVQRGDGEDGVPPEGRQALQVLCGQAHSFAGQGLAAIGLDRLDERSVEPEGSKPPELAEKAHQRAMSCRSRWLTRPGERAQHSLGGNVQKGVQCGTPAIVEPGIDLTVHIPVRLRQGVGGQTLDHRGTRCGDGPAAKLLHEKPGERCATRRGQGLGQQPSGHRDAIGPGKGPEPERGVEGLELVVAGLGPDGVVDQSVRGQIELVGDERQNLPRHDFTAMEQTPRIAQCAELDGKAEAIVSPPPPGDDREVGWRQGIVTDEVGFVRRQGEQRVELGSGHGSAAWHGGSVPIGVMAICDAGRPSWNKDLAGAGPGGFNWDRARRSIAGSRPRTNPASVRSAICVPSPSAPATRWSACSGKPARG